jgi:hypothetical protein
MKVNKNGPDFSEKPGPLHTKERNCRPSRSCEVGGEQLRSLFLLGLRSQRIVVAGSAFFPGGKWKGLGVGYIVAYYTTLSRIYKKGLG